MEKGKRGRKPLKNREELKIQLPIYLKISTIKALGGTIKAKEVVIEMAEKKVEDANR